MEVKIDSTELLSLLTVYAYATRIERPNDMSMGGYLMMRAEGQECAEKLAKLLRDNPAAREITVSVDLPQ